MMKVKTIKNVRQYTLETRINKEEAEYFSKFITEYSALCRRVWQDMLHGKKIDSKYVTKKCNEYGYLKRTVNSAIRTMQGRLKSLIELQKVENQERQVKIKALDAKIYKLKQQLNSYKNKLGEDSNNKEILRKYKNIKLKLYSLQERRNKLKNKVRDYKELKNRNKICFGSKKEFNKQYNLDENRYKTHEKWLNTFRKKRDNQINYVGSKLETSGNQVFQIQYIEAVKTFILKVRKEDKYCTNNKNKYIELNVDFKYRKDLLIEALKNHRSLTYRVIRRGNKWYIQVMFSYEGKIDTSIKNGCIGLDYNNGFIALTEVDKSGNISKIDRIGLRYHGTGNKAKSEIEEKISKILRYARNKGKSVVIEDLEFKDTKSKQIRRSGKDYNRMLHRLDYSRYKKQCEDQSISKGVGLIEVNPAYTSKKGKKYVKEKKMNIHNAAAYVIARRGMGFKEISLAE